MKVSDEWMRKKEWTIFAVIIMLALSLYGVFLMLDMRAIHGQIEDEKIRESLGERPYIIMIGEVEDHAYWNLVRDGGKAYAEAHHMYLHYMGPENPNPNDQRELLRQAIDIKPDGLIVQGISDTFIPLINEAIARGIPVVTVDSDQPDSDRISYVGTDNYAMGQAMARDVLSHVETIKAGVITGSETNDHHQLRLAGIESVLNESAQADILSVAVSNIKRVNAREKTYQMLRDYPDINVLVGVSALDVIGMTEAMDVLGREDIYVVGFDTLKENLELLAKGRVDTLVSQQPYEMGMRSMDVIRTILNGHDVPEMIHTESRLVRDVTQ